MHLKGLFDRTVEYPSVRSSNGCLIYIDVKNMHPHRVSNPGPWNTVQMLWPLSYEDAR